MCHLLRLRHPSQASNRALRDSEPRFNQVLESNLMVTSVEGETSVSMRDRNLQLIPR